MTPVDEWSARRWGHYLQDTQKKPGDEYHALGGIPTHDPSRLVSADLRVWSHGQRNLLVKRLSCQYTIIDWGFSTNDLFCNSLKSKYAVAVVVGY